ncbi:DUF5395 family protein [Desulfobulbus rhabdoformis]|uniref:DUF5395 family protein n=1 Tax=Desulfobulbus rhabdoformis TaxID=34032 RepID=UPI001965A4BF|nr:DUF5395 family protein [Desulfobulbus rhabdoformis]MBM9615104.1 DUF5395 family protein [Desulfobulbus rhabdoformis]
MFFRKSSKLKDVSTVEMMLDHDGQNWIVTGDGVRLAAQELDDLDRELEKALKPQIEKDGRINVFMSSNNEMIPEWMRPFMNHYFNRCLELPLRY